MLPPPLVSIEEVFRSCLERRRLTSISRSSRSAQEESNAIPWLGEVAQAAAGAGRRPRTADAERLEVVVKQRGGDGGAGGRGGRRGGVPRRDLGGGSVGVDGGQGEREEIAVDVPGAVVVGPQQAGEGQALALGEYELGVGAEDLVEDGGDLVLAELDPRVDGDDELGHLAPVEPAVPVGVEALEDPAHLLGPRAPPRRRRRRGQRHRGGPY